MKGKFLVIGLIVVIIFSLLTAALATSVFNEQTSAQEVNEVFVDINQDGNTDLLLKGQVIFNRGDLSIEANPTMPLPQPQNQ